MGSSAGRQHRGLTSPGRIRSGLAGHSSSARSGTRHRGGTGADSTDMPLADGDRAPYHVCVRLLGLVVIAAAVAVVAVGWGLDVPDVRSVIPGAVAMEVQTALGLGAAGAAILLLRVGARGRRRTVGLALASVPGLLGLAVLCEYALHLNLGIDEFPFTDHDARAAGLTYPGRFAPVVGVCFLLLSGALFTLDRGAKRRWRPSELLAKIGRASCRERVESAVVGGAVKGEQK